MRKRINIFLLLIGFLCFNFTNIIAQGESELHHVIWENEVGVSINGNYVTKTSSTGWNAGMFSTNKLSAGQNGKMEYKVKDQSKYHMVGFADEDLSQHHNTIDYAWYIKPGGALIYMNGSYKGWYSSNVNDVLEIEKTGSNIYFKKNGVTVRTEYNVPNTAYYVDVSIYHAGTFEFEVKASFETKYAVSKWRTETNLSVSGSTVIKTAPNGWDAGFFSEGKIPSDKDGFIQHIVQNQSKHYMVGLSTDDPNANYNTVEFAWYVNPNGTYIYKNGTYIAFYGGGVGDVLRIEKTGNKIYMIRNNITMRTYTINPSDEYHIDGSFHTTGTYDVPIDASFPNPAVSYAVLKKKLDGSCTIVDGDIKFKFIQEYAVIGGTVIECKVYDWQRDIVKQENITPQYGVNWLSIPSTNLQDGEVYTLEFEGNKGQKYFLKFKYKNQDI